MKGALCLLLTISLLLMIQMQTGVLGNQTKPPSAPSANIRTTKNPHNGTPELSNLGWGSILLLLTNTLLQLFYLS